MKGLLFFAVFVLSLDSTALSLVCVHCTNNTIASCSGKVKNCTEDESCMSTITQSTAADGQKTYTFDRDCGEADQCNSTGSITSLFSIDTRSTCCDTDSCTPRQPKLIVEKKLPNDIQCPVCLAHSTWQCSPVNARNCTGDEKYCAVYKLKSDLGRTIIMGCASESFCHNVRSKKLINGKITEVMTRCIRSWSDSLKTQVFHLFPVLLWTLVHTV